MCCCIVPILEMHKTCLFDWLFVLALEKDWESKRAGHRVSVVRFVFDFCYDDCRVGCVFLFFFSLVVRSYLVLRSSLPLSSAGCSWKMLGKCAVRVT